MKTGLTHIALLGLALIFFLSACGENSDHNSGENKNEDLSIPEWLQERVKTYEGPEDMEPLMAAMEGRELILLGEASHGTHEYYHHRGEICRRLIEEQGLDFIAVEGDWASIFRLNRYVKGLPVEGESAREIQQTFDRWPEWMWANEEVEELVEWLRDYNADRSMEDRVGFYGMDVYAHLDAIDIVKEYVEEFLPEEYNEVEEHYKCLLQFDQEDRAYARAVARGRADCREKSGEPYEIIKAHEDRLKEEDQYDYLEALGAALVVKNAEEHYRKAPRGDAGGWNSRASHFYEAVNKLRAFYGKGSRAAAWGHNTHMGDARATRMSDQGRHNIGQLARQDLGRENVFALGFSTYRGEVKAGEEWGKPGRRMNVPEGIEGSIENKFNQVNKDPFLWLIDEEDRAFEPLDRRIGHRAIGVTYNPEIEHRGNYVPTNVPDRYDGMIFLRETVPLKYH